MPKTFDELLTMDELAANTRRLASDERVTITPVGVSRCGNPIEMISLGEGPRDALIVGVPHTNEPIGAVTVERMIDAFLGPGGEAQRRGFRWHFIKAIDPEGLRMNEGWMKQPLTIETYTENYFRPQFNNHPDALFPLKVGEFSFDRPTPENLAFRKAFELTRPALHASLHHWEYGGVCHMLSRPVPGLPAALDRVNMESEVVSCLGFGNGNGGANVLEHSRSVVRGGSVAEAINQGIAEGMSPASAWTLRASSIGETSLEYGESNYGTLGIISEVPLWDDPSLLDERPSGFSAGDQVEQARRIRIEATDIGARHFFSLARLAESPEATEYMNALRDFIGAFRENSSTIANGPSPQDLSRTLSVAEYRRGFAPVLMVTKIYSNVIGLSKNILKVYPEHQPALLALREAKEGLGRALGTIHEHLTLTPIPIAVLTGVQMNAILACAEALA